MPVPFSQVPNNLRVPFFAVEVDNSQASQGPALLPYSALLIGQKTSGGSATANTVVLCTSADQAAALAGRGSMLHNMAKAWFADNQFTPVYLGVLADNGAGAAAVGSVSFTGPATAAGTLSFYAGGQLVTTAVASGDAATAIATNFIAAVNANADLPVTAAVDGTHAYQVNLTFRHKGAVGNQYDLRFNYQSSDATPAGVTATIAAMAGGATNPTLTTLIAALGDTWFQVWAHPYTDATSLSAIEAELDSRFGPMRMIDGVAFCADNDTIANLATLGNGRNDPHSSIIGCGGAGSTGFPTPPWEVSANVAAIVALYGAQDPARPFQTLASSWILPPAQVDQLTLSERNTLLYDGISTLRVVGGHVQIERLITTYKTNTAGSPDTSYLDVTTMLTLMYLRYSFRANMLAKYPRHKLAADGVRVGPGQPIITPKLGKAEAVLWFGQMLDLGLVQKPDDFKANLVVAVNSQNPNRLDFLLPPTLIGQLIVGAVNLQFRL